MGTVIDLASRRAHEPRPAASRASGRPVVYFDLACPFTYLALERVERALPGVVWRPALTEALVRSTSRSGRARLAAERRAAELGLPLVWPAAVARPAHLAMRAAGFAAEQGRGGPFALAAARLAYCGGFELDDPEVLAEAAAAAGLRLDRCLDAAGDESRDAAIEAAGRRVLAAGGDRLPAIWIGRRLHCGERAVGMAALTWRAPAGRRGASGSVH